MRNTLSVAAFLSGLAFALEDGFGLVPLMGYNSYNDVACSPNSTWMEATMRAMNERRLIDLGYKYFQVDCGWQGYQRQANGSLTYDVSAFPNGIRPLADFAISLGLQWSMYTDQGVNSCDTRTDVLRPGSLGYEEADALQFAGWNTVFVKIDNCYVEAGQNAPKDPRSDFPSRYKVISDALLSVGIKGIEICQWGTPYINSSYGLQGPAAWTPPISTSFRISDDITDAWSSVLRIVNEAIHAEILGASGPGHFADLDLLEVGNHMTFAEQQTHFAIWVAFKSPLMVSTNVVSMSDATYSILSNQDLITISQDPLGEPVKLVQRFTADYDLYTGNLQGGDTVVLLFDQSNQTRDLSLEFTEIGISSATVKDVWAGDIIAKATSFNKTVPAHGNVVLRLSSITPANIQPPAHTYYSASSASVTGGANIQSCTGCSGGNKIGDISVNSSVTISNITATSEIVDVLFDYINCEIGYTFVEQGQNIRVASISVNGGGDQLVEFPISGYNWDRDVFKSYKVRLIGFHIGKGNNITISAAAGSSAFAPDIDRIGVPGVAV